MGEAPFSLPSSSKWEVADRQEKMGKEHFVDGRLKNTLYVIITVIISVSLGRFVRKF